MVHHVYRVVAHAQGWGVEHIDKLLDVYATRAEAEAAVERLAKLTQASGHDAEVVVQDDGGGVESDRLYPRVER